MKNIFIFFLIVLPNFSSLGQNTLLVPGQLSSLQNSAAAGKKAISGVMTNSIIGSNSNGVFASIESTSSSNGVSLYATHAGSGYGVRGSSVSGYGIYSTGSTFGTQIFANQSGGLGLNASTNSASLPAAYFSNISNGLALKTTGGLKFSGSGLVPGNGKILRSSDANGLSTWDDYQILSTDWAVIPTAWRDSVVDGTAVKVNYLNSSCISTEVLNKGMVKVYLRFGSAAIPLPYSGFAGGAANTITYIIKNGKILIMRFTHNAITGIIGISSALEYRAVIILPRFDCGLATLNSFNEPLNNPCNSSVPCENEK